jgi:hypothetical protein
VKAKDIVAGEVYVVSTEKSYPQRGGATKVRVLEVPVSGLTEAGLWRSTVRESGRRDSARVELVDSKTDWSWRSCHKVHPDTGALIVPLRYFRDTLAGYQAARVALGERAHAEQVAKREREQRDAESLRVVAGVFQRLGFSTSVESKSYNRDAEIDVVHGMPRVRLGREGWERIGRILDAARAAGLDDA